MPETTAGRMRRRRWPWVLLALALLALAGTLALRHVLRPDRISAFLVGQVRDSLGAELTLGAGARYGFVPELRAVLPDPVLRQPGAATPFIRADALQVTLPWRNLWSDQIEIPRLLLLRPVLELDALDAWLAARPAAHGGLPELRLRLDVEDGTLLRDGRPIARDIDVALASRGDAIAWLQRLQAQPANTALLPPASGSASVAELHIGEVRMEGVELRFGNDRDERPAQH